MFSAAYKRYALLSLTAVYTLNLVDRGLMILLLQPIKEDLQLSDTQLGFLTGIAFGLFYATLGVPIARWADRGNRVTITSMAIGLWGLTVMACMFVTSYLQLVVSRVMAAVGNRDASRRPTLSWVTISLSLRCGRGRWRSTSPGVRCPICCRSSQEDG
jgi:MFS family permease